MLCSDDKELIFDLVRSSLAEAEHGHGSTADPRVNTAPCLLLGSDSADPDVAAASADQPCMCMFCATEGQAAVEKGLSAPVILLSARPTVLRAQHH
jgi:hypothetical protein